MSHTPLNGKNIDRHLEYGLFIAAISCAMVAHSISRRTGCPRLFCKTSSHFRSSYAKRRWGWMMTFKRRARTKQLYNSLAWLTIAKKISTLTMPVEKKAPWKTSPQQYRLLQSARRLHGNAPASPSLPPYLYLQLTSASRSTKMAKENSLINSRHRSKSLVRQSTPLS